MVNVYDHAHNLARAIKGCPEYVAFAQAKIRIKSKPTAEQMVTDFHKRQMELQSLLVQGKSVTPEQEEGLKGLYTIISGDADVREYLAAEQRFSVILNDIYKILGEAIDVGLPANT